LAVQDVQGGDRNGQPNEPAGDVHDRILRLTAAPIAAFNQKA
jgi:hypothetical protein